MLAMHDSTAWSSSSAWHLKRLSQNLPAQGVQQVRFSRQRKERVRNDRPCVQLSSRLARRAMGSLSAFMNQLRLPRRLRSSATRSGRTVIARVSHSATWGATNFVSVLNLRPKSPYLIPLKCAEKGGYSSYIPPRRPVKRLKNMGIIPSEILPKSGMNQEAIRR